MRHLILDTNGIALKKRNNCFWIVQKQATKIISPLRLRSIVIISEVMISTAAIKLAVDHEVPIYYCDRMGNVLAKMYNHKMKGSSQLRLQQVLWSMSRSAREWMLMIIQEKINQQYNLLKKQGVNVNNSRPLEIALDEKDFYQLLRTEEAILSKSYWIHFREIIPEPYIMHSRSQRPAKDIINCLLNYFYGFLYTVTEQAIWANGLDPYVGVMHSNPYQKPVLSFDMIEPFRYVVEGFVVNELKRGGLEDNMYKTTETKVILSKSGKQALIPQFMDWMLERNKVMDYTTSIQKHIYRTAYMLRGKIKNQNIPKDALYDIL